MTPTSTWSRRSWGRVRWGSTSTSPTTRSVTAQSKFKYGPFGETSDSPSGYAWRYTGQHVDAWTGLYWYKAREYAPTLARFLQADPALFTDGPSIYAYVGNDPGNRTDPAGLGSPEQPATIYGNAQASTPLHAKYSNDLGSVMSKIDGVRGVYLNSSLASIVGEKIDPRIRPDVTVVMESGKIYPFEVPSPGQTRDFFYAKFRGISGRFNIQEPQFYGEFTTTSGRVLETFLPSEVAQREMIQGLPRSSLGARVTGGLARGANILGVVSTVVGAYSLGKDFQREYQIRVYLAYFCPVHPDHQYCAAAA